VKIREVVDALERFAPLPLQEDWDNAGLQVGITEAEVSGALLCLDVTEEVVDEALRLGCNLIVSHHPLIFRALKQISGATDVQRIVIKAIQNNVAIVSMHTNMDNARGGVNFKIAEKLGLSGVRFIGEDSLSADRGSGVVGEFLEPVPAETFIRMLKERFGVECVQCNQLLRRGISSVAVCGGSGSFMLDEAVKAGADAFVTGEMHYHEFFGRGQQIQIAVIGHYQSEKFTSEIFYSIIKEACPQVRAFLTETDTNPIIYF